MRGSIDPKHLITLECVARLKSFAAAADELAFTQSAISQQIQEIERRVDMRVLQRRPVRLTQAGKILLQAELTVRTATATALQALSSLKKGNTGNITVAAFASAAVSIVPSAIGNFRRQYPNVQIKLSQLETEACYARILRGEVDLALVFDYDLSPQVPPASIKRKLIIEDPIYVVMPITHPLATEQQVNIEALKNDTWIASQATEQQMKYLFKVIPSINTAPSLNFEGDDLQVVLSLIKQGLGIALLPKLNCLQAPEGVIFKPIVTPSINRYIYTARLQNDHCSSALLHFEQALVQNLMIELQDGTSRNM